MDEAKLAYYEEQEKKLKKEIRLIKIWMWVIVVVCLVPAGILGIIFHAQGMMRICGGVGIIGIIAEGIIGHQTEKKLEALQREKAFGNEK